MQSVKSALTLCRALASASLLLVPLLLALLSFIELPAAAADRALPAITLHDAPSLVEGDSGVTNMRFQVTLSAASSQVVTVHYATADAATNPATAGVDYVASSGTLTFNLGITSRTVTVGINGDTADEVNEKFLVNLSNPTNATIADGKGGGIIKDDDGPAITINNPLSITEGDSGTLGLVFSVRLSALSPQTITVRFATANDTATASVDYAANSGTLTFDPGVTAKSVIVAINGDMVDEVNEAFFVNLSNASGATIADNQGKGTIRDDDGPAITIDNPRGIFEGDSGTKNMVFTVHLSASSPQTVQVDFLTVDNTATAPNDYVTKSGRLSFAAGQTSQNIIVLIQGDTLEEGSPETFWVNLSNPLNATVADSQAVGYILDNDGANGAASEAQSDDEPSE